MPATQTPVTHCEDESAALLPPSRLFVEYARGNMLGAGARRGSQRRVTAACGASGRGRSAFSHVYAALAARVWRGVGSGARYLGNRKALKNTKTRAAVGESAKTSALIIPCARAFFGGHRARLRLPSAPWSCFARAQGGRRRAVGDPPCVRVITMRRRRRRGDTVHLSQLYSLTDKLK